MDLRRRIARVLLRLIWRVEYRLCANGEVAGIKILGSGGSAADRAQLKQHLHTALRYLEKDEAAYRAVTEGLDFVAIVSHETRFIQAPRGLALNAQRGLPTNPFHFALALIWSVRAIEMDRQGVSQSEYEPASFEAQIAFARRFPDAGEWVCWIERVRDRRAQHWVGADGRRSAAGEALAGHERV